MRARTIVVGALAVALGLVAAFGVWFLLANLPRPAGDGVEVVVAARDLPRFTTLTPDDVKVRKVPKEMVPPAAITKVEGALDRGSTTFVGKGEILLDSKVSARGVRGMAAAIPPGMRAVTIRTPDVSVGVAGFTLPGSKVDVLLTERSWAGTDATGGGSTVVLMERVEVLAVDQRVESPADAKVDPERMRSVTLLVTPEQAAMLELGQTVGTLHLSLRHPQDESVASDRSVTLREVRMAGRKPDAPPAAEPRKAEPPREVRPPRDEVKPPPPQVEEAPPIYVLKGSSMTRVPVVVGGKARER